VERELESTTEAVAEGGVRVRLCPPDTMMHVGDFQFEAEHRISEEMEQRH
jgi:hypothetical protein